MIQRQQQQQQQRNKFTMTLRLSLWMLLLVIATTTTTTNWLVAAASNETNTSVVVISTADDNTDSNSTTTTTPVDSNNNTALSTVTYSNTTTAAALKKYAQYIIQMDDEGYECYNNLTVLHEVIKTMTYFQEKVFHICPNVTYNIGVLDDNNNCCSDPTLHRPIWLRGNTQYICGKDGNPSNNCIFRGGAYQIRYGSEGFGYEPMFNVRLRGITFGATAAGTMLFGAIGDITIEQCIIRDCRDFGPIASFSWGVGDLEQIVPVLDGTIPTDDDTTSTSSSATTKSKSEYPRSSRIHVYYNNCSFINNSFPLDQTILPGIITFDYTFNALVVNNSLFYNNSYNDPKITKEGYAIKVQAGSLITVVNSCFYDNNFLGKGMILTNNTNITIINNNFAANNGAIKCPFWYNMANKSCTPADATACTIRGLEPVPTQYTTTASSSSPASDGGDATASTPSGSAPSTTMVIQWLYSAISCSTVVAAVFM